jgi:hypothetical protein
MDYEAAERLKQELLVRYGRPLGPAGVSSYALPAGQAGLPTPALGVGITAVPGRDDDFRPAVRVQSRALRGQPELSDLARRDVIDLRFVGRAKALYARCRCRTRPVATGISVGHWAGATGTLGCFVRGTDDPNFFGLLSCQHVLASTLDGAPGLAEHTIQAGRLDHGHWLNDRIGYLARSVPISRFGTNTLDCAASAVLDPDTLRCYTATRARLCEVHRHALGRITGVATDIAPYLMNPAEPVFKLGRSTGPRHGFVTGANLDALTIQYAEGPIQVLAQFAGFFEIEGYKGRPFSEPGDSGSVVVDRSGKVIGLVFAGTQTGSTANRALTYAIPIRPILDALQIEILLPAPGTAATEAAIT